MNHKIKSHIQKSLKHADKAAFHAEKAHQYLESMKYEKEKKGAPKKARKKM